MKSIVFLHGWGMSGEAMQPLASLFRQKGYTTYAPDLPGFGSALPPTKPWSVDDYVEWLKRYIDDFRALAPHRDREAISGARVILVTQSFGGRVAIKFVVKYPELVGGLIMCGVPGIKERLSWKRWMLKLAIRFGKWWLKGATWELWVPWPIRKYIERKLSRLDYFKVRGVMRETFVKVVKEDLRPSLKNITTPTLLVWGEQDTFVPLSIARSIEKEIPNAKLVVIPNTAHNVYRLQPNLVAQHIFSFLLGNFGK